MRGGDGQSGRTLSYGGHSSRAPGSREIGPGPVGAGYAMWEAARTAPSANAHAVST